MTSRERVLTTFDHREPDRVPAWCGASPEFWANAKRTLGIDDDEALRQRFGDDFRRVSAVYPAPAEPLPEGVDSRTVFGIDRRGIGYGQPFSHPLEYTGEHALSLLDRAREYPWPDPATVDVSHIRGEAESYGGEYAILGGDWSPFWHDAIDLLGMEGLYMAMYDAPELVDLVFEGIVDFYAEVSRRTFEAAADVIDIFFIGNDFGAQNGPLLGEKLFRRFLVPHLARLVAMGHDYGLKVMLHCCGGIAPLIPAMIEIGVDGLHAVQSCCAGMNLAELKSQFGEAMVFNGAIDSQHILIEATTALVRERTREVLRIMMPGGGYIAGASHDYILEETPVENVVAMFDTVREFGRY